jgi:hypothetical protein
MARVKIDIRGDGSGFHKAMGKVEDRLKGLKEKVGFSFGETFAALAGGATIAAMVENMANFAKEVNNASTNLGVTTQRVQQLRIAARHAGKDLGVFEGIFTKSEGFASKALVPHSKEANIAARLGISAADLSGPNGLSKDALLTKMLQGTNGMSRNVAEELMGSVVGKKNASFLVGNKSEITGQSGIGAVSNEDLNKMMELKENFEDLIDVVRARMIPAFNDLVDWAVKFVAKVSETKEVHDSATTQMEKYATEHGTKKAFLSPGQIFNRVSTFWKLAGNEALGMTGLRNTQQVSEARDKIFKGYYQSKYGKDAFTSGMSVVPEAVAKVVATREQLAIAAANRRQLHADEQAAMNGPTTRERPVIKTSNALILGGEGGKASSGNVHIGGLMGVDSTYRLSRIGEETNKLLREIRDRLTPEGANTDLTSMIEDNMS